MNFNINESFQSTNSEFEEALDDINDMFTEITEHFRQKMNINDKIRIVFYHDDFTSAIEIPFVS